ncbi:MAG: cytochrome P450 [Granulosicoccaceae bacterium]
MHTKLPLVDVDPRSGEFYLNPYPSYARWHREHPRFYWRVYGCVCFASYADVDGLLRDRRFARVAPASPEAGCPVAKAHLQNFEQVEAFSLLNLEPPRHTQLRQLINKAFVSSKVEKMRDEIEQIATELIDQLPTTGEIDLLQDYLMPLPAIVIARLLGVPQAQVPQLLAWSHAMVKVYTLTQSHADDLAANQAAKEFSDYLQELITQKRKSPSPDLLSHLLSVEIEGRSLSDAEIISTAVLLLNAGHEATVHQTGNAIKTILQHEIDPRAHFQSPQSVAAFVEEALRFDAPLHLFKRFALERVVFDDGLVVEAGEEVALLFGAANRDPARFSEPDRFNPSRDDAGHVSFGAGLHFCLGAPLARLEMQISLSLLFKRLPSLALASPPAYADSFHFHGLQALRVRVA